MGLRDIIWNFLMAEGSRLPPGIRFRPEDDELVVHYLKMKVMGKRPRFELISEVDIYKFPPWDLPEKSILGSEDLKWYFFCPLKKKYSTGDRMNRTAECGFWKVTGNDRPVHLKEKLVGHIKTLIFHEGRAKGARTDWVLHEYRLEDKNLAERYIQNNKYVLCVIFQKDGPGPRNGAQYGVPYKEEDWNDDEEVGGVESGPYTGLSTPAYMLPSNCNCSVATGTLQLGSTVSESCLPETMPSRYEGIPAVGCVESGPYAGLSTPAYLLPSNCNSSVATGTLQLGRTVSESCFSETMPSHCEGLLAVHANNAVFKESGDGDILSTVLGNNVVSKEQHQNFGDDDIPSMIACFTEDNALVWNEDDKYKNPGHGGSDIDAALDPDIFKDLEDLSDSGLYFEMNDLDKPLDNSSAFPP
ncbi:NAC domain-containing protein 82-like [Alnus glutinosa]|uniref:NAC domain-containing protein 82-like n=1 Tax=Alnus glutinosa TaxID=3517 RepID=UPI002D77AA7E|nr:NAC domain-containing protein 82-like [Alnus glutinosa]